MGDQPGPGSPTFDRQCGHRRLDDGLAGPAAQLGAKMLNDLIARREIFQHVTLVLPDVTEHGAATARANADRIVSDNFTGKMPGQRLAHRMSALGGTGPAIQCRDGRLGLSQSTAAAGERYGPLPSLIFFSDFAFSW